MTALITARYLVYIFKGLNVYEAVREALNQHPDQIESLLKDQLQEGISSTGKKIAPKYTNFTEQKKAEKGQPYDRVTLYDEGDLYRSIFLATMPQAFDLDKYEPRSGKLFALTKEHIKQVAQIIKPDLEKLLIQQIRILKNNVNKELIAA
jgi:hypothetical protein